MVERIRALLESQELTPTQFADAIGVARPIVSHILSGRNKPSLDVVQRILAAMPDLAMPWLLNGTGPMFQPAEAIALAAPVAPAKPVASPAPAASATALAEPPAAPTAASSPAAPPAIAPDSTEATRIPVPVRTVWSEAADASASVPRPGVVPKRFTANLLDDKRVSSNSVEDAFPSVPAAVAAANITPSPAPAAAAPAPLPDTAGTALASALLAGGDKPIRRIVIFYHDGSFADYQPE